MGQRIVRVVRGGPVDSLPVAVTPARAGVRAARVSPSPGVPGEGGHLSPCLHFAPAGAALRVIVAILLLAGAGSRPAGAQPAPAAKAPERVDAGEVERAFAKLEAVVRDVPRDRFDPEAVIEMVGRDPAALYAWVREHTAPLPYRGALRGSRGVLADRVGNSLDRSLLLAELVRAVGYSARLANAALPPEQAAALAAVPVKPAAPPDAGPPAPDVKEARERVERQAARLAEALGAAAGDSAARARDDVADHWWVQWLAADGKWSDLDVAADGPGRSLAPAARTLPLTGTAGMIPTEARDSHEVELRVVIEAFRGGKLVNETVLKHTFRPAETLGRGISFTHFVGPAIKDADLRPDAAARKRLKAALVKQEVYVPALRVGDRPITEASFTTAGEVDRNPKVDAAGALGGAASKTFGGFGGGLGGGGDEKPAGGVLTAEWIEYEVRVPGRPPLVLRREVFDLVGPAARAAGVTKEPALDDAVRLRRALRLLGQTQVLLQPCNFSAGVTAFMLADHDLREKQVWLAAARGEYKTPAEVNKALSRLAVRDEATPLFAAIRHGMGIATFVDRPNIVHHRVWLEEAGDQFVTRRGMDLALTSAAPAAGGADGFRARLTQGVADTLAEHLALGAAADEAENAVFHFEAMARKGGAPVVVRGADAAPLAQLGMPPDVLARASVDLAGGDTLVVAGAGGGRWAWWRVDPATGQSVGVMDNGYNSALTDKANLDKEVGQLSTRLGHKFVSKDVEFATREQMMKWAGKDAQAFQDLIEIQGELRIITAKLIRAMTFGI